MARIGRLSRSNILNIVYAVGIFIMSWLVTTKLAQISGLRCWFGTVFFFALYFAGLYEIPVREGRKSGMSKNRIVYEVLVVWVIPLLLGYGIGQYFATVG